MDCNILPNSDPQWGAAYCNTPNPFVKPVVQFTHLNFW